MSKCIKENCTNQQFRSSIYNSEYCGEHLDIQPIKLEDADQFFRKYDKETQELKRLQRMEEGFRNMIYHAECGRLPNNWIIECRKILEGEIECQKI